MNIVAIKYMSAGNESVGDMWRETKIFPPEASIMEIFRWASNNPDVRSYKGHIEITIAQD